MHYLMLITITLPLTVTSAEVRDQVFDQLQCDPSFCGDGGRFTAPLCDWFVIGGRWSGYLRETTMPKAYRQAVKADSAGLIGTLRSAETADQHRTTMNTLWHRFGGTGDSPALRDSYDVFGYEDDAMVVDRAVYDSLLAPYAGFPQHDHHFIDLDDDPVDESFIGRKWLIVVDYHN
jgi:hypothetical protein